MFLRAFNALENRLALRCDAYQIAVQRVHNSWHLNFLINETNCFMTQNIIGL